MFPLRSLPSGRTMENQLASNMLPVDPCSSGGLMEEDKVGPKGIIRRSDFVTAIAKALRSLGYVQSGEALERESGLDSHLAMEEAFKKQVLAGSWKESVDTLQELVPKGNNIWKRASFMIFEQKFFELLAQNSNMNDAWETLRSEITPLKINQKRVCELSFCMFSPTPANPRSKLLEELQKVLTPTVLIPEGRLEHLVEQTLIQQRELCHFHNSLDKTLSLYTDHACGADQIPSRTIQILEGHVGGVLYLQFSNNGKYLASSSMDNFVIIWEVQEDGHFSLKHKLRGHQTAVMMVAWSPDDQQLLSCGRREVVRRWDVMSGECLRVYEKSNTEARRGLISCGWLPNGKGIFAATTDYRIYWWSEYGRDVLYLQGKGTTGILDMVITKDGKTIIKIEEDESLHLYNTETKIEKLIKEEEITSFSLSCDAKYLLVNLINDEIHLWNIEDEPECWMTYKGHKNHYSLVRSCFGGSQEGFIASGSKDSQVYIWQRDFGDLIHKLPGHSAIVYCVSWNPVNPFILASASADSTIRIWGLDKVKIP